MIDFKLKNINDNVVKKQTERMQEIEIEINNALNEILNKHGVLKVEMVMIIAKTLNGLADEMMLNHVYALSLKESEKNNKKIIIPN